MRNNPKAIWIWFEKCIEMQQNILQSRLTDINTFSGRGFLSSHTRLLLVTGDDPWSSFIYDDNNPSIQMSIIMSGAVSRGDSNGDLQNIPKLDLVRPFSSEVFVQIKEEKINFILKKQDLHLNLPLLDFSLFQDCDVRW